MTRILVLAVLLSVSLPAANYKLAGVVTDSTGGSVAAVTVEVVGVDAKTAARTKTDIDGKFTSEPLPPGAYVLNLAKKGFEPRREPVTLLDADAFLRIALMIAKQQYSITVDGGSSQMDTATEAHQDAFTLDQKTFSDLAVKDGDILSALSSFVNPAGGAAATIIVDGMERTDADLPLSSIQQVRINNNAYSAEFPKPGKGRIEIDTRGGDDALHGGLIVRARNSIFDARNPLANEKLPFSRNGYDANINGPIIKKKLWFFLDANYEGQQQSQPVLAYLPSGLLQTDALSPVTLGRFLGRLDWQPTQSHRLGVKYELHIDKTENSGIGGFSLPDLATNLFHRDYRVEISDQYIFSPEIVNNFRIALGTNYQHLSSINDQPLVIVQGAFSNGGAQVNEWRREPRTDIIDTLSYVNGPNEWKFGIGANFHPFRSYNADNFGGTYTFASLGAYEAGQPTLFTISAGNPLLSFQQNDYSWFAQYERKIGSASVFAGVRHEFQSGVPRHLDLAPRVATAFAPGKNHRTVVRIGAGIFYDRRPPPLLEQSLRFNGLQTQQYILENPLYPVTGRAGAFGGVASGPEPGISADLSGKRHGRAAAPGRLPARHRLYLSARQPPFSGARSECAIASQRCAAVSHRGFHRSTGIDGDIARKRRQLDSKKPSEPPFPVLRAVHAVTALRRHGRGLPSTAWYEFCFGQSLCGAPPRKQLRPASGMGTGEQRRAQSLRAFRDGTTSVEVHIWHFDYDPVGPAVQHHNRTRQQWRRHRQRPACGRQQE
jgi:hypothetical protein